MKFIDRHQEMKRLMRADKSDDGGLVVVWGRRRLGKSRLLTEWCGQTAGVYWVADESAPAIQRRYLAEELVDMFPGFADVAYSDWPTLLNRLSREARQANWRGPLVLDEFPYLVVGAPELPSILQKWIDREKREGGILLALSGSSQRMMMDTVLNSEAPLYGRADQILKIESLLPGYIRECTDITSPQSLLDWYTCWGGVPRYWKGNQAEWDVVSTSLDDKTVILGECKSMSRPAGTTDMNKIIRALMAKPAPTFLNADSQQYEYVIFVPELNVEPETLPENITVVDGKTLFSALTEKGTDVACV